MIEKLKEWSGVIALLAIILTWIVPSPFSVSEPQFGAAGSRFPHGISTDATLPSANGEVRTTSLVVTATSTLTTSPDGFVVGGTISTAATNTPRTVYTNTTGPKFCDASTAFLYINNNGSFSPAVRWSLGTSTSAIYSNNLVASSTVATSTDTLIVPLVSSFILAQGDVLTATEDDANNANASTTYFSNMTAEAGVWCQSLSI